MIKNKSNYKDVKFFLIPFVVLFMLFGILTYFNVQTRINEILKITEESTVTIADSYADALLNSKEASAIVTHLLDEKILVASKAVLLLDDTISNLSLIDLAERFQVDQINLYNAQGEIIYSSEKQYIGWQAYEGHPVNDFIKSNKDTLVEDIRQDTENKKFYKYGYVKRRDNTFVQIGVLAENIHSFTSKLEIQQIIEKIITKDDIKQVFFIDQNFKIIASTTPEQDGILIENPSIRDSIENMQTDVERRTINGEEQLNSYAPVFYNNEWLGTLFFVWDADLYESDIQNIIFYGVFELLLLMLVIGAILNFAYKKNQSNIKIAYYDTLTELPNAAYLDEYLSEVVKKCKKQKVAILLINCTNFKTLNITYGFKYGDMILKQIANSVKNEIPSDNMFFRFNADRFVLVVEDYKDQEALLSLAQKLIDVFRNPFDGGIRHEYVNVEIAVFEVQSCNIKVDKILQDATLALNNINSSFHEQIIFFDQNMEVDVRKKDIIETTIRAIISGEDKKSFHLEYQPKLDMKANRIMGFEALARMNIDSLGFISPPEFIELAEKRSIIYELGNHIMKEAFGFISALKNNGYEDLTVAVNLSAIQLLRDEFIDDVNELIKEAGIQPSMLEFEITESILLDNFEIINNKLNDIKKLGIAIALDDFGTGYSSFARLRELKVDTVKIDQYFISKISELDNRDLLTADIISMSHKLGLHVVAEGVEKREHKEYLDEYQCDILQGYLISKPLKYDKALEFLSVFK